MNSYKAIFIISCAGMLVILSAAWCCAAEVIDWSKTTPIDFLETLESGKAPFIKIGYENVPPDDWIREKDLWELILRVGSEEPASPVISGRCPYIPARMSTVGNEAMYLIEGFRSRKYPPTLSSVYDFKGNAKEYRDWWNKRMSGNPDKKTGALQILETSPTREEILNDSKPKDITAVDAIFLRTDIIETGSAKADVLVNRLTGVLEYVWSGPYNRYIRPKFIFPNAQTIYEESKR